MKYLYDEQGYYVGPYMPPQPPEPEPDNLAEIAPPQFEYGFIAKWSGTTWEQVENHKGEKGYVADKPFEIKEYGPYPAGWSDHIAPKPCYQYDADGYYCGIDTMYNNLLPNNATLTQPDLQDGYIPKWDGEAWNQVENHKGDKGYVDGKPFEIKEHGLYPSGWSSSPPEPTPKELKQRRIDEIKAELDRLDLASIRALRVIDNGTDTVPDHERLIEYETQATALRSEMKTLEVPNDR